MERIISAIDCLLANFLLPEFSFVEWTNYILNNFPSVIGTPSAVTWRAPRPRGKCFTEFVKRIIRITC